MPQCTMASITTNTAPGITQRHIEVFRAVMNSGGVTAAAHALNSSQPTVSRELARMAQLLGYDLFTRQRGRLVPTVRAQVLFDEVQRAYIGMDQLQRFAQRLADSATGPVTLSCQAAHSRSLLPGACQRFHALHPNAQVVITPQESPWLEESLSAQRHDLGLSESTRPIPGTESTLLLQADEVCILPRGHALAAKAQLTPQDFAGQPFVSLSAGDPYRQQMDAIFAREGVQRQLRIETHSADAVCAMVMHGLGLAIVNPLTALTQAQNHDPALLIRPFSVAIPYAIHLVRPRYRGANGQVEAMVEALARQAVALQQAMSQAMTSSGGHLAR